MSEVGSQYILPPIPPDCLFRTFCSIYVRVFSIASSAAKLLIKFLCSSGPPFSTACLYASLMPVSSICSCSSDRFSIISSTCEFCESSISDASELFCCWFAYAVLTISAVSLKRTSSRFKLLPFLLSLAKSAFNCLFMISCFFRFRRAEEAMSGSA